MSELYRVFNGRKWAHDISEDSDWNYNGLIYLTAIFSDISFTIDEKNMFRRGPLGFSCHIASGILRTFFAT